MTQIQCANCGLKNKATQTNCIRCYASLEGLQAITVADVNFARKGIPLWVKLSALGVVLCVLLVAGVAFSVVMMAKKRIASRYTHFENAIRVSEKFNLPSTEDVGRYSYWDNETNGTQQEATPAAYKLAELGLLYIHNGQYSDVPTNYNSQGKVVIDPYTGLVPRSYRHVTLEPAGKGLAESVNWEPYENKKEGKVGWKVPTGTRELGRVVQVMSDREMGGTSDGVMVSFTWKWKPNEVGQAFDKGNPSSVPPTMPKNFPRNSFDFPIDDSRATYWGSAQLHKAGDNWVVDQVFWHGTAGVRLSPNQSAEIEEMIRKANQE